jgi:hypothetical protein
VSVERDSFPNWTVYDAWYICLTRAARLDLPLYTLKGLLSHEQPNSDWTGGYLVPTPERLHEPARQVEDRRLQLTKVNGGGTVHSVTGRRFGID